MGSNLSQVFVSTSATLLTGTTFNPASASGKVGVWNQGAATPTYTVAALFDTSNGAVSPSWTTSKLQLTQGTAGNPIATPLIDTRNIKRFEFTPYLASAGHKQKITGTTLDAKTYSVKFIFRNTPTDQLSFHDGASTGYNDLSGAGKVFPLGAFNATNHKVISVEVLTTAATITNLCGLVGPAVEAHALLNELLIVTDVTVADDTYTARHAGVVFDVVLWNETDNVAAVPVATATAGVIGVGNPWQILGEEIRCRSRQGNFNRMYLPQNVPTYTSTTAGVKYHKITIEYAHNWPSATGIAPAGELNQVVLYVSQNSATILDAADNELDTMFVIPSATADVLDPIEYTW